LSAAILKVTVHFYYQKSVACSKACDGNIRYVESICYEPALYTFLILVEDPG